MRYKRIWVLIADGARARIVRDLTAEGDTSGRPEDLVFEADHKPMREIMSDRPGRAFTSQGARRAAMEYHSDPVRDREEEFATTLVSELVEHHTADEFDALAIIAEPRMLGLIRQHLPASIRDVIAGEVPKDLTKLPVHKLRDAILDLEISGLTGGGR
jgi:protein required for attachment to host cells